jgi:hypothetical protein
MEVMEKGNPIKKRKIDKSHGNDSGNNAHGKKHSAKKNI